MKSAKIIACLLICFGLLYAGLTEPRSYTETEFLMDTIATVTAYGAQGKKAIEQVFLRLRELDRKCNAYLTDSEIGKINAAPANTAISVDREVFSLIQSAFTFSENSENAFDITLLPVSRLWGFGTKNAHVPTFFEINNALELTGSKCFSLNATEGTVTKAFDGVQLDLGGAVKGYAAQVALQILKENGVEHAYLDLGGNVAVMGGKPLNLWETIFSGKKSKPFTIGLQTPDAPRGTVMKTISLSDGFIVTSGSYERYFEQNGMQYHHILDPATGQPANTGLKSVTVVTENGLEADMLSTALFVLGKEKMSLLSDRCEALYVIDNQMNCITMKELANR